MKQQNNIHHSVTEFEDFELILKKYIPIDKSHYSNMGEQLATVLFFLINAWFSGEGYCPEYDKDETSFVNWIETYIEEAKGLYKFFEKVDFDDEYSDFLYELSKKLVTEEVLKKYTKLKAIGDIFNCDGNFDWQGKYSLWDD